MNDATIFQIDATNLPRLMNCNGSRNMVASFPGEPGDPKTRDEGNAAHWLVQQVVNGKLVDAMIGQKAFNNVTITSAMAADVSDYIKTLDIGEVEAVTTFGGSNWRVNARCDHRKYRAETSTLTIDDFKYGYSIVEPVENWTLIAHAIGTCAALAIRPDWIVLRIYQPRAHHRDGPLREWQISYDDLMQRYAQIVTTMTTPNDLLVTGYSWCRHCHALPTCPAATAARMNAIDAVETTFNDTMPNDALSYQLDLLRNASATLKAHTEALEELAAYRLRNGQMIENYATEQTLGNRRWLPDLDANTVRALTGVDVIKSGFVTPAEAERRGFSEQLLKLFTERPITGTKLVRINADKRARRAGLGKGTDNAS